VRYCFSAVGYYAAHQDAKQIEQAARRHFRKNLRKCQTRAKRESRPRLGITFEPVEAEKCETRGDAIAWIIANQLGRRNLTPSPRAALALEIEKQLAAEAKKRQRLSNANRAIVPEKVDSLSLSVIPPTSRRALLVKLSLRR
jgi:hypothetical protein